jgi:hypothetical protein
MDAADTAPETLQPLQFVVTIPKKQGAIGIDGGDGEGGRIVFDVAGDDIGPLLRLTMMRGKRIKITAEPID